MRWGVGKGKFRNLTATILSVFLVAVFLAVWTFFQHIKPLTIDTTPQSQTAGIRDRLINEDTSAPQHLIPANLLLFNTVLDSVNQIFQREFPSSRSITRETKIDSVGMRLHSAQVSVRKTIAALLNQQYVNIDEYRRCEATVMAVIRDSESKSIVARDLRKRSDVQSAEKTIAERVDSTHFSAQDRLLIEDWEHRFRDRLFPLRIGLSADDIQYAPLAKPTATSTEPKGKRK